MLYVPQACRALVCLLKRFVRIYPFHWIDFLALGGRWVFTDRMGIGEFLTDALLFSST